jgi:hypothetical protein
MNRTVWIPALLAAATLLTAALPTMSRAGQKIDISFDADDFDDPLTIDNPYWPLVPGTTFTYAAGGDDECELDVFMVTGDKEVILGIETRVVQDDAYIDANCNGIVDAGDTQVETTKDWPAQDKFGNVWYFGEDTLECDEGGCNDPAGSWRAGVNDALPGIFILAEPRPGDQHFQEIAEDEAEDQVKYLRLKVWVSLYRDEAYPPGEFHNCWKTKEWTKLDVGHIEHKFYCRDVGLVAVDELKGKTVRFELIDIVTP